MDKDYYIDVIELRRISQVKELKDAFELRTDRPAVWLQRLCFWVLRKLGCYAHLDTVRVERHDIGKHGDSFMSRLLARRNAVMGSFEREPTKLLIGSAEYAELMEEAISNSPFNFDARYMKGDIRNPTVYGLKVEVIPYMRGMLLLY